MFGNRSKMLKTAFLLAAVWAVTSFVRSDEEPAAKPAEVPVAVPAEKPAAAPAEKRYFHPVLIRFEGTITPMTEHYLFRKLEVARKQKADLIVIEIDSPGGYLQPSLAIAEHLRDLNWAHTVAFIPKYALSGAAIASLGCDEIIMNPQAKIGDAGAIYQDEAGMFRHAPEKIRSHLARHVRDLAEAKKRAPALAEAMVDKDLNVFRVRDKESGRETYLSDAEIRADAKPDRWEKVAPLQEAGAGNFFEVNGTRAVELQFAQGTTKDRAELHDRYKLDSPWTVMQPGDMETIVYILNLPFITGILIVVGLVGLYFEFCAPGTCVGGLIASLCFTLFFWSRFFGGTSGWLEVLLFVVGAGFFAVEIFVLPGFGVAGFAGLALMGVSLIMASQDFIVPETASQMDTMGTTMMVLVGSGVSFIVLAVVISRRLKSIPVFSRMVLAPPAPMNSQETSVDPKLSVVPLPAPPPPSTSGVQVGDQGIAESALRPAGKVRFDRRYVDVVADGTFVDKGTAVQVVRIQGNCVVVREIREKH